MLYLTNKTNAQTLFVPRNGSVATGSLSFTMQSTVDRAEPIVSAVTDNKASGQYFIISVALPEGTTDGEYEYTLTKDELRLASGLLYVGKLPQTEASEYDKTIEYEQYD